MLINTLFISKYQNTNHIEIKNNENQKLFAFLFSEIMNVENEKGIINLLPEHVGGNISEYKSVFVNYNFDSNVSLNLTSSSNDPIVNLSALLLNENELDVKSLNETEKIIYSPQQFISSFTELIKTILKSDKEISSVSLKLFSKNFIFNHSVDNSTLVDVEQLLKETFEKETIFSLSLSVSNKQVLFEILPQVESSSLNIRMNDSVKGNLSLPNYDGVLSSSIEMSSQDFANEESKNSNHRVTQENHNKLHEVSLHKLNPSLENANDLIIEADSSLSNENKTEINTYLTHKESQSITKTYNNELSKNQLTSNQLNTLVNKTPSIEPTIELSENKGISNYQKNSFNHNKNQQTSVKIFVSSFDTVSKNQSENDNKLNNITSNFENSELIEIAYRSSNSKITEDKIFYTKEDFLKNQLYNERQIQHIFRRIDSNSNYISKIISNNNAQSSKSPTINFDFQNDNFIVNKLSNENNSIIKDNSNNQLKNHSLSNSHNSEANKQIPSNSNYPQSKIDISKSAQILVNDEIISSEPLNKTHISKEFQVKETFEKTVNTKLIEHNNNTDKNSLTSSNSTVNFNENKSDKKIVDYKHSNKILFETNTDITKKTALSNTQNSTFQKNNHKENSNVSVNNQNLEVNDSYKLSKSDFSKTNYQKETLSNIIDKTEIISPDRQSNSQKVDIIKNDYIPLKNEKHYLGNFGKNNQTDFVNNEKLSINHFSNYVKVESLKSFEKISSNSLEDLKVSDFNLSDKVDDFELSKSGVLQSKETNTLNISGSTYKSNEFMNSSINTLQSEKKSVTINSKIIDTSVNSKTLEFSEPDKGEMKNNNFVKDVNNYKNGTETNPFEELTNSSKELPTDIKKIEVNNLSNNNNNQQNNSPKLSRNSIDTEPLKPANLIEHNTIARKNAQQIYPKTDQFEGRLNLFDEIANSDNYSNNKESKKDVHKNFENDRIASNSKSNLTTNLEESKNFDNKILTHNKQDIHNELNLQSFSERKIQSAPFKTEFEFSNNKPENNLGKNLSSLDNSLLKSLNNFAKTLSKLEYNIQAELSDSLLNDGSVELKLYPEELGKMRIFLESKENSISIRIEVQSEQVKNLILSNLTRLKDSFSFEGLNLQNLSVYFNTNEQKSQNGTNHKRKNYNTKLNTSIANNEEEIKIKNLGYNTIEYLA